MTLVPATITPQPHLVTHFQSIFVSWGSAVIHRVGLVLSYRVLNSDSVLQIERDRRKIPCHLRAPGKHGRKNLNRASPWPP